MARTSLKTLARHLRLSASTVSRALNDHPDISSATKLRVRRAAERYEYSPDTIAQSLKTRVSRTVGVIVPEIRNSFFSSVISGLETHLNGAGYTLIVCQSNEDCLREASIVRTLVSHRLAGVVASIAQNTTDLSHFHQFKRRGIPFLLFDRAPEFDGVSRVVVDDEGGARAATEHLIARGYQRIAHLAGPVHNPIGHLRERGFRKALVAHGRTVDPEAIVRGGLTEHDGIRGMQALLARSPAPDAVFCVTDLVAIGAYAVLRERGIVIPGQMAVVGFSNNPLAALLDPPLTSVDQPSFDMGIRAATILLEEIAATPGTHTPRVEVLTNTLIIRKSS